MQSNIDFIPPWISLPQSWGKELAREMKLKVASVNANTDSQYLIRHVVFVVFNVHTEKRDWRSFLLQEMFTLLFVCLFKQNYVYHALHAGT